MYSVLNWVIIFHNIMFATGPLKFISRVRQLHDDMLAKLWRILWPIPVTNGVKQGCVLAFLSFQGCGDGILNLAS